VYEIETRRQQNVTRRPRPTMELLNPIKAFLAVVLIRIDPSDGNGDLSTVSGSSKIQTDRLQFRY